jgi:hypothetical protein
MIARAVLLAALLLMAQATVVSAAKGVAVDLGLIEIDEPLSPGGTYRLPTLGVRNAGDELGTYSMHIGQTGNAEAVALQGAWFTFSPSNFQLEPGASTPVTISLHLPANVPPGRYEGLLSAGLAPEGEGAQVGAAAAARLTFEVQASSSFDALLRELTTFVGGLAPWSYVVVGLLAVGFLVRRASRRFSVRLERRG